jgi:hypothetical protein
VSVSDLKLANRRVELNIKEVIIPILFKYVMFSAAALAGYFPVDVRAAEEGRTEDIDQHVVGRFEDICIQLKNGERWRRGVLRPLSNLKWSRAYLA